MLAILSPAKTLDFESSYEVPFVTQPQFQDEIQYLVSKIKDYSPNRLAKLMNVSEQIAHLNVDRYQNFSQSFEQDTNARPAALAFKGDVYLGLDSYSLDAKELQSLQNKVAILSGLYGVLKPLDLMQPYRLEMGLPFKVTAAKSNLYKFWDQKIQNALEQQIQAQDEAEEKVLVNLASNEYAKAAQLKNFAFPVLEIDFKEKRADGNYKTISFNAKKARGLMARFMVKENLVKAEDLKAFNYEDYAFNPNMSTDKKWTFTR